MNNFSQHYYEKYWQHRKKTKNIYSSTPLRISLAANLIPSNKPLHILDVGTGEGSFAKHLNLTRHKHTVDGIEVSPTASKLAKNHYSKIITSDVTNPILDSKLPNNHYDYIISLEVVEHIINPNILLKLVHKKLKKSGTFILSVPNTAWWKYRLDLLNGKFIDEQPSYSYLDHLHFFTLSSIKILLDEHKFKVKSVDGVFSLPSYLGRLQQHAQRKIGIFRPSLFAYQLILTCKKK